MSTFVEFRDRRNPGPSFVRPIDASRRAPPSPSYSAPVNYGPRTSNRANKRLTPLSPYPVRVPPPPVDPIYGIPGPAPTALGAADVYDEGEMEYIEPMEVPPMEPYMEFDAARSQILDTDVEAGGRQEGGSKRFVGGFVANLKKLPRAMARNLLYDRRHPHPQLDQYTYASDPQERKSSREAAPPYDAPGATVHGNPRYVQGMQMPGHIIPSLHLVTPTPSHSASSLPSRTPSRLSPHNSHSQHHSKDSSLHSGASLPRTVRNPDPERESSSSEGSPTAEQVLPNPYPSSEAHPPAGTVQPPPPAVTFPEATPLHPQRRHTATVQTPTYHEPPLAADYQRMASPVRPPPEPPLETQVARIGKFFNDINNLPWFSSTIAADFIPAESGRARHARSKSAGSWYSSKHREIDLLAGGPSTHALVGASGHSLPQSRGPMHASSATLAYGQGSQLSIDAHAQQPMSAPVHGQYPYPVPPVIPPPQLYMYQAAVQPVMTTPRATTEQAPQETQQVYPLYMLSPHSPYMHPHNTSQQHTPAYPTPLSAAAVV
ncbi:hypothetical protein OF83DRAFT_459483 [Amylostereum chailletii]|nr:hypothetical protein OF83DRAFT_459483 [Amylostereum chailletii]